MTIRSTIAMIYVIAAAIVSLVNGPGAGALAGELAVFSVFEIPADGPDAEPDRAIAWEWEDPPAYETPDEADYTRTELARAAPLY